MIPFKKVYRMRHDTNDYWTIVMGLTPLPRLRGLWMIRASSTKPARDVYGDVFEGDDGRIVVAGTQDRYVFEPLTMERWDDMKSDVQGFDQIRAVVKTDEMLQSWYWDEFSDWEGAGEAEQGEILQMLREVYTD